MPPITPINKAEEFKTRSRASRESMLRDIEADLWGVYEELDEYICDIQRTLRTIRARIPKNNQCG